MSKKKDNPYLHEFIRICGTNKNSWERYTKTPFSKNTNNALTQMLARNLLVTKYAWAVPNPSVLQQIVKYSPLVEIGAGTGYWAKLITDYGGKIVAYDLFPPTLPSESFPKLSPQIIYLDDLQNEKTDKYMTEVDKIKNTYEQENRPRYHYVWSGGPESITTHPKHTLFICWPSYDDPMAVECLKYYRRDTLIYIGEESGGCCADNEFWKTIESEWICVKKMKIHQWFGIHDSLLIFKRK